MTSRRHTRTWAVVLCTAWSTALAFPNTVHAAPPDKGALDHFEKKVRPLLVNRCLKCHSGARPKGKLRLDSADALRRGGESGAAVVPGKPEQSLLIKAVRYSGELHMPPDRKLSAQEVNDLVTWVKSGAVWPGGKMKPPAEPPPIKATALAPNAASLRKHLQAWYRADTLPLTDGKPVVVWPDSSGKGRDLSVTAGVRTGGVGKAATFLAHSTVNRRPAVRFGPDTGLATSPHTPVDIRGNAALTIVLVLNLQPNTDRHPFDGIIGLGNPANPGRDPGKPLAALVQITRTHHDSELQLAGGWNHDATLGKGSFNPLYNRTVLLSVVKNPGPMQTSTRFFIDGLSSEASVLKRKVTGRDTVPDIRHRSDIGLYLGKALGWCGSIRGDIAEVVVFNKALSDAERSGVEYHLADRYALVLPDMLRHSRARFTAEQKAFWAFRPVKQPSPPAVKDADWPTSPIDRFILAKLEAKYLKPAPPADRRTLIRRVTFDLTGLPPTPAETDAFLADTSPGAFARVVDRLLASPHYGERWGRHWLDVARYAETTANDANAVMRYAWRYRDYVVDAFNRDTPYDRFLTEQLAGDLLPDTSDVDDKNRRFIATGFLMVGPKALAETDKEQTQLDIADEQIDVTGRAFLGLTLSCARCHDHKFDPIPAVDYYALAGIFRGTSMFQDFVPNASMWPEYALPQGPGRKPLVVMAPREGVPVNLKLHVRGNRFNLGHTVPRRFPQILAGEGSAPLATSQSGRLELARWIASPKNPLTARVLVNRLWQHHFGTGLVSTSDNFGSRGDRPSHPELLDYLAARFVRGGWSVKAMHRLMLLSSAYRMACLPNPAAAKADPGNRLLWRMPRRRLEAEAIRDAMLAVSGRLDRTLGGDRPSDYLWARAEVLGGTKIRPNQMKADDPYYTTSTRRSLYLPVVRNMLPDVLALFDAADPNGVSAVRNETTVPAQTLFLLNNPFVRAQALHFARALGAEKKDADRVRAAYRRSLGRLPSEEEVEEALEFLADYTAEARRRKRGGDVRLAGWQSFCQVLLCSNEFLYVD
jgi:hypothetical protein